MAPMNPHPLDTSGANTPRPDMPPRVGGAPAPRPPVAPPPGLSAAPSFFGLIGSLRRRWPLALLLGLLAGGLAAAVTWNVPYLAGTGAVAVVRVASTPPRVLYDAEGGGDFERYLKTQAGLIKTRSVLEEALRKPQVAELPLVVAQGDNAVAWLEKDIVVESTSGSELLRVTLKGDKTDQLAVVLSAVMNAYIDQAQTRERQERLDKKAALEKAKADQHARVEQIRGQITARITALLGPTDPADPLGMIRQKTAQDALPRAEAELNQLRNDIKILQTELDAKTGRDGTTPPELQLSESAIEARVRERLKEDDDLKQMQTQIDTLEKEIAYIQRVAVNAEAASAKQRRAVETLRSQVETRQRDARNAVIRSFRETAQSELNIEIGKLDRQLRVKKELETAAAQTVDRLRRETQVARTLPEDVERLRERLDMETKQERRIDEELVGMRFRMDDPPRVTLRQDAAPAPRDTAKVMQLAGGAGLGVFGAVLFGFAFLEFRSRRINTLDDVAQGLGIRVLGAVPKMPGRAQKNVAGAATGADLRWQNMLQESVDVTRTILLHAAQHERLQVVMVASAVEGEGKTSLASQLAASLARAGRKTLLVDCDLRKPAAHKLFGLALEPGFCEMLRGEVGVADVVQPTRQSRLWLIPAGVWDPHATQALAQDHVQAIFTELRDEYECVIVDSSPVLPVADALLVAQHADAVVFSILRDESRMPQVYSAWQRMANLGVRMLGAVVHGAQGDVYGTYYGNALNR